MTLRDALIEAWMALRAHRLRTALSGLGILVGVAAVIAALAIGKGARREAFAEFGGLGIDNLYVRALPPEAPPGRRQARPAPVLTAGDVIAIGHAVPAVDAVAGARTARVAVTAGPRRIEAGLVGVDVAWGDLAALGVARGRWLSAADVRQRRRVAVLGPDLGRALFGAADPLGREVLAGGVWYRVAGVLEDRAQPSSRRRPVQVVDADMALLVPVTAMDQALGDGDTGESLAAIGVRLAGTDALTAAVPVVRDVLERRHRETAWEIVVPRALLEARLRAQRTFNFVLLAIGALALIIGGAGITNILLASVAERTHEIGVRRAVGARGRDVVTQFAVEAALLCLVGAAAGIPAGAALAAAIAVIAGWPVALSGASILLALLLALIVGLTAGVHPARVAARLDPVEALRAG